MPQQLEVEGLIKAFSQNVRVVDDVCFTVPAGEIAVLLGPSGCGKTTLLRMIAGLETPDVGSIRCGTLIYSDSANRFFLPAQHRNLAMVFQSYAIWPHMTVAQNVEYPLKRRGVSREVRRRQVEEALRLVGLEHLGARASSALSGGQMQRVALARSMAYDPTILLLDEPMSNLDPELRARLRADLRSIIKKAGLTAVYVTHDQEEAAAIGDCIGVMDAGKMLQFAPTETLFAHPAKASIARFTGATNSIEAIVEKRDGDFAEVGFGTIAKLRIAAIDDLRGGESVRVLFRPENARLGPRGGGNSLPGRITYRQFLGGQAIYTVKIDDVLIEARDLGTTARWAVGDEVSVDVDPAAAWGYRTP